jgi:hypothetical protein
MLTLTLQHGITESTSCAFAWYGSVIVFMGQRESAYQFGKLALALCDETTSSPEFIARTLVTVTRYLNHYKVPIHDDSEKLRCKPTDSGIRPEKALLVHLLHAPISIVASTLDGTFDNLWTMEECCANKWKS